MHGGEGNTWRHEHGDSEGDIDCCGGSAHPCVHMVLVDGLLTMVAQWWLCGSQFVLDALQVQIGIAHRIAGPAPALYDIALEAVVAEVYEVLVDPGTLVKNAYRHAFDPRHSNAASVEVIRHSMLRSLWSQSGTM
eukprot:3013298-Amphidinium_carterae.2